ncbi:MULTISPECIES: YdeI/OmpD-associated family protein [Hymenobacter]|uniref:DUF1905 domain-containing protein n=1 Tax=Hymenobacter jejuensis TaxID=2502781 RepID=A0A5B8A3E8_9BACT|nr:MULTISPECIES: YdeI/OmpD-associated family protein [Hymenobacter]MBC6990372.1 DUF1905 domain-containing protein [Hymenobacter sp. BT491]QDA61196.1 DUF1905 domain-containing protein [Hymenobacter jejuensis]
MSDSQEQAFDAPLELHNADGGVFLTVPFSVPDVYGQRGLLHVRGTIDGFPFRLPLTPAADGEHILTIRKQIRNTIGKTWGETVHVVLAPDTEESAIEVPEDLARALDKAGLRTKFDQLAYNQRQKFALWISRAKKPEARFKRIQEAINLVAEGRKLS